MSRLFTLDEARRMLPVVRDLVLAMRERKLEFDRHREAYELLNGRTGDEADRLGGALARHRAALEQLAREIQELLDQVQQHGVEVKGIDQGLVDFRAERDGRVVYLCWMLDEPDISWWHDLNTGFRGRMPL
jgi:hypothetical protein